MLPFRPSRVSQGFSLMEILTAIAIIAICSAMIFPYVGKLRDKATSAGCVANLRASHVALSAFAADAGSWPSVNMNHETSPSGEGTQLWFVPLVRDQYVDTSAVRIGGVNCLQAASLLCPGNKILKKEPYPWTSAPYPVYPSYAMNVYWGERTVSPQRVPIGAVVNGGAILLIDSTVNGSRSIYATDPSHLRWDSANCKIPRDIHPDGAHALLANGSVISVSPATHPDIQEPRYWNPRYQK